MLAAPVRPTAADGSVTTMEDTDYTFTAANFNYAAGNANSLVSVIITEAPAEDRRCELLLEGSQITDALSIELRTVSKADLDAGKLTFIPSRDGNGTSFKFKVNDGTSDSADEYTMTITVTRMNEPTNTPPTASNRSVTTDEDTEHTFAATNFGYLDVDFFDVLVSVKITGLPASGKGELTLDGTTITAGLPRTVSATDLTNGRLKYAPPSNANGNGFASFKFRVNDGTVDSTAEYTMTINVTAGERSGDGYADDQRNRTGGSGTDRLDHRHYGFRRPAQQLHLPVDAGGLRRNV